MKTILSRRWKESVEVGDKNASCVRLPDGIMSDEADSLRTQLENVTKKVYSIMDKWRCTGNTSADTTLQRYRAFSAWGPLLKLIALYIPSSAAVERVFS